MRTKIFGILFIFFLLVSCKKEESSNGLIGNWYGFDPDSLYYELYISDTLIILNHENMGLVEYTYERDGQRLITTTPLFFERVWNLETLNDSIFIIRDTLETHLYRRLDISPGFFESMNDSAGYYSFKEGFMERIQRKRQ
ncbi:hypothetical protein [Cecembia calidifontis]|jgi:hypothetical protein|uniref:Lipocalin-like protein n=1 Tax=Cecembia calidifontis TaxID=1187080 RepID=A0A4Q7P7B5_9BACT|nr:hypothetical protein [Cecembia calidifontis]RZS95944.1 hypothetical protein BC751_1497 [Cecembia calidifontis]